MSRPNSVRHSDPNLPQVSVGSITPHVVDEMVAAFRLEIEFLLKDLLKPMVEDLKDLRRHQSEISVQGNDHAPAEKIRNTYTKDRASRPADTSAVGTTTDNASIVPSRVIAAKFGSGALQAETKLEEKEKQSMKIEQVPEGRISTPLVDSLKQLGHRLGSLRGSSSAREGYHLTPRCDSREQLAAHPDSAAYEYARPLSVFEEYGGHKDGFRMTINEKLRHAQESMHDAHAEQPWVVKCVTSFLEDPESSYAAKCYSQFITVFSIFSIFMGLLPFVGYTVSLRAELILDSTLCLEVLIRAMFCPHFSAFLADYRNLVDSLSAVPVTVICLINFDVLEQEWVELSSAFLLSAIPVIRFMRFVRRFPKMQILFTAFKDSIEALPVLLYTLAMMGCIFTSALYLVEPRENIANMSESAWLVISTISTVGYGDVTPSTKFGAALASILMVVSQLYMAMPFGIIGYNFTVIWGRRSQILLLNGTRERLAKWGFGAYEIPRLFELFDLDDSAEFDMHEFQLLFKEMDIGFKEDDIVELFKIIDKDAGGTIDEREFVKIVYPNEYRYMYQKPRRHGAQLSSPFEPQGGHGLHALSMDD